MNDQKRIIVADTNLLQQIRAESCNEKALQFIADYRLEFTLSLSDEVLKARERQVKAEAALSNLKSALKSYQDTIKSLINQA